MNGNFVINLGRQLGSGGKEIGERIARDFHIACFDKELIRLASQESGLGQEFFERADEKASKSLLGGLFGTRFPFITEGAIPSSPYLSNDTFFQIQSDVIRRLAGEQSCLFVGRCADYILRDHPRCVNVFISADPADRVKRICEQMNVVPKAAQRMMEHGDEKRASFYNFYSANTWGAAETYHLCINSSVLGIEATAQFIKQFALRKLGL